MVLVGLVVVFGIAMALGLTSSPAFFQLRSPMIHHRVSTFEVILGGTSRWRLSSSLRKHAGDGRAVGYRPTIRRQHIYSFSGIGGMHYRLVRHGHNVNIAAQ